MKQLRLGTILKLDEREYVVVATAKKENIDYVNLITTEEPYKVLFGKVINRKDDIDLEIITKKEEKIELMELFKEKTKEI